MSSTSIHPGPSRAAIGPQPKVFALRAKTDIAGRDGTVLAGAYRAARNIVSPQPLPMNEPREPLRDGTNRGTPGPAFPSTRWSRIVGGDTGRDLEALAQAYWRPVQAYLRASLRIDDDAAAELAQEAFAWMLHVRLFDRADPARGSFRGLLKSALRNFAIEVHRRESTLRRGGGTRPLDLDAAADVADSRTPTPDAELDAAWRRELLEAAHARLDAELTAAGRRVHYLVFRDYFLDPSPNGDADYGGLAQRYGLTRIDVGNRLAYAKRRYRELLHAAVRETVTDPDELRRELSWLFGDDAVRTEAQG